MRDLRIVHLSDVHYGLLVSGTGAGASAHRFIDEASGKPRPADLTEIVSSTIAGEPDIVAVSGDLGWAGSHEDYGYAFDFLSGLRERWPTAAYVLNGGNHDVDLSKASDPERQDAFIDFLKRFYGGDFEHTFAAWQETKRREDLAGVHYKPGAFLVVSINTGASIQKSGDPILVSPSALKLVDEQIIAFTQETDLFRVFVLHHHLLPFAEPEWQTAYDPRLVRERPDSTIVANSARLQRWLARHSFHLVLHGHKHLFHAREDALWGNKPSSTRKIIIVGAGSAGVARRELAAGIENGLCLVKASRVQKKQWRVEIQSGEITTEEIRPEFVSRMVRRVTIGDPPKGAPAVFHAEDSVSCHVLIRDTCENEQKVLPNFLSVVDSAEYIHPATVRLGPSEATEEQVKNSFFALHPEYDPEKKWNDVASMDRFFRRFGDSYRILHGPRMFAPVRFVDPSVQSRSNSELRPIYKAAQAVAGHASRAYVGLYDPLRDITSDVDPLPGLVGVQFVPYESSGVLDIVMTFRNLELSFWWAVNFWEACQILEWARVRVAEKRYSPGRVIFFAAVAEWREDPRPMYVAEIDTMAVEEMFFLISAADASSKASIAVLAEKIEEKARSTSSLNIDYRALELLLGLARGCAKRQEHLGSQPTVLSDVEFVKIVDEIVEHLRVAVSTSSRRGDAVAEAERKLFQLAGRLRQKAE